MPSALRALILGAYLIGTLEGQTLVEWSKDRKLSKQDFKGKVPNTSKASSFSWLGIDASWGCADGKPVAHARATFDPSRSWWKIATSNIWENIDFANASPSELENRLSPGQVEAQLLSHEQTHFDITELAARRIRKELEILKEICATPGAAGDLDTIIAGIDRELQREQARYDRETAHGTNAPRQREWDSRVRRELQ